MADVPPLPGAVGVSHLRVYDWEGPDGLAGGTPHLHTACSEAYAVVAGSGSVETISGQGFRRVALTAGSFVWFTPGTIHRLVNDGGLEILVVMQNAGLPEAGDMVLTLDPATRADAEAYARAATLPPGEDTTAGSGDGARRRRDAAVTWFLELRAAVERGEDDVLSTLYADAARLVSGRVGPWREVWERGPLADVQRTEVLLDALVRGDASHLAASSVHALPPPPEVRRMGCCGTLGTYIVGR